MWTDTTHTCHLLNKIRLRGLMQKNAQAVARTPTAWDCLTSHQATVSIIQLWMSDYIWACLWGACIHPKPFWKARYGAAIWSAFFSSWPREMSCNCGFSRFCPLRTEKKPLITVNVVLNQRNHPLAFNENERSSFRDVLFTFRRWAHYLFVTASKQKFRQNRFFGQNQKRYRKI